MANVDPYLQQATNNRDRFLKQGQDQTDYLNNEAGKYDALEGNYRNQADQEYSNLAQTPGYTDQEASAVNGNPNAAFNYYNPEQLSGDVNSNDSRLTDAASGYGSSLNDAAQKGQSAVSGVAPQELNFLGGTYNYLKGANDSAYGDLDSGLNQAIDPSKLSVSDEFSKDYQLSPEQAENIKDVAGNTVRGQYQKMSDDVDRRAAAQGNSSPAAIAAIKQQMGRQGAIDAGDAMSAAELNVNNTAAQRQKDLESMRLGANQDLSTRQTGAATTRYGAASGAAKGLADMETQGTENAASNQLSAAGKAADLGYEAANAGGQAQIDAAKTNGTQQLGVDAANQQTGQGLATNADNTSSARAGTVAGQRIAGQNTLRNYYTGQQGAAQTGSQTATGQQIQNNTGTAGAVNTATGIGTGGAESKDGKPGLGSQLLGAAGGIMSGIATAFADGGVVDQPTDAVIGENGPEAVVPLSNMPRYGQPQAPAPQQPSGFQKFSQGMGKFAAGMRGDGQAVPGNQPGGANGAYGRYGQTPNQQPTPSMSSAISRAAQGAGSLGGALHSRYGTQGRVDHAMNQGMGEQQDMRRQGELDQMQADPQMAHGGIVTKPTRAIIGENGPEAIIPLDGHAGSKVTPGMMPRRYNPTGETELRGPMRPMQPASLDPHMKQSNWKRYDMMHHGR